MKITYLLVALTIQSSLVFAQSDINTQTIQNIFQNFSAAEKGSSFYHGSAVPDFHLKGDTKGSPYLLSKWVKGSAENVSDSVIDNPNLLFNYNKITGTLLITADTKSAIEVDNSQLKSFQLNNDGLVLAFERIPFSSDSKFYNILNVGQNYRLYKLITTKFIRSDFRTNGMITTGNNYDEYADEISYVIYSEKDKIVTSIELKKKSVKNAFNKDKLKVEQWFAQNKDLTIDEGFLKNLVSFLN